VLVPTTTGAAVTVYEPAMPVIVWLEVTVDCWPLGSVTVTLAAVPVGRSEIVIANVAGVATAIAAVANLVASCVEVAFIVAVPAPVGVKTPTLLTVPLPVGLTDHVTDELKLPVPLTAAVHVEV